MSHLKEVVISGIIGPVEDAFGRLRVSTPLTRFDTKQLHDSLPLLWDDVELSGGSTTSTHDPDRAATLMGVAAATAGVRVRQTFQRFYYQPGKSQLIFMTFIGTTPATAINQRVGYFNDDDGIFLNVEGTTVNVTLRSSTSGSPVDTNVAQASWSLDVMDGTGPSGVTLDLSKAQILIIDFEWLGTGRVRIGFIIDGNIFFVHEFNTANVLSVVYMSTPNLPLRYEIENTGAGGATILEHLCSTVISEGGVDDLGILRSQSLEVATVNANVIGTYYALLGIRQKSARLDSTIAMIRLSTLSTTNDPYHWQIRWNPTVAGTFVYADETNSLVQIAKGDTSGNPSANTVTSGTIVDSGYGTENSSLDTVITNTLRLGATISGTQDEIVLCVTPGSVNLDITGAFTWRELA